MRYVGIRRAAPLRSPEASSASPSANPKTYVPLSGSTTDKPPAGLGLGVMGLGCGVQGSGFRVEGSGLRVQGSGFRVQG